MCGRFSQSMSLAQLLERFSLDSEEQLEWLIKYNVAPSLDIPVLVNLSGVKKLMLMKWGLMPPWAKDAKYQPIINLRTETVLNKPGFKRILESSRCIVPVDGFNEWKAEGKTKLPYRFVMKTGETPHSGRPTDVCRIFSLGGLYQAVQLPTGKTVYTVSLITTEANSLVSRVHDRMPVIIPKSHEEAWLNPKSKLPDYAICLSPYPSEEMNSYPVSTKINSGKIDSPDLIQAQ
jgi:putative SOS response-associated peptidase YedK